MEGGVHLRGDQPDDQRCEIQRVEQDRHGLVPTQHYQYHIHPVWNLRNARHGTPLRLDVVRIRIPTESIRYIQSLCLREDRERRFEVELVRLAIKVGWF